MVRERPRGTSHQIGNKKKRSNLNQPSLLNLLKGGDPAAPSGTATLLRLSADRQSHLGRTPPLRVSSMTSGTTNFRDVTGGVYKARERIHRGVADPRLLAIPTSCSRVADYNPDYDRLSGIGSPSRVGNPLYRPLYDV